MNSVRMKTVGVIAAGLILGHEMTSGVGHANLRQRLVITSGFVSVSGVHVIPIVNKDQFQGKWKRFKGELKKRWGKFTDDDLLVIEGNYDKFEGKLQERYGDQRDDVQRWVDDWFEKHGKQTK